MKKEEIASVIETSPVRLTSDETRLVLRAIGSPKPLANSWGGGSLASLTELGLFEKVPMETAHARSKRLATAWLRLKSGASAKNVEVATEALKDITSIQRDDMPSMGYVLTDLGRQVARGITVRITKR